jgi:saccharopine dehydrogenase-like NADP-dependent oxidoreductase
LKLIILGAGLVGGPMAIDLVKDANFQVSIADINKNHLNKFTNYPIETIQKDLSDPAVVTALVKNYDLVISAVPGFMGFKTLQAIIKASKNVVDIAFFPEDPFVLDELAKLGIRCEEKFPTA